MNTSLAMVVGHRDPSRKLDEGDAVFCGFILLVIALYGLAAMTEKDVFGYVASTLIALFVGFILIFGLVGGIKGCAEKQAAAAQPVHIEPLN
jgi:hypothetical protein